VVIDAVDLGDRYDLADERGRHPLLEGCVDEVGVPDDLDVTITIRSAVPPGASTGTSASVAVALVAGLSALRGETLAPDDVARRAWRVEAERVGRQTGIQDQRAAAHGGVNRITIRHFPDDVAVDPLDLAPSTVAGLEARLLLVLLDRPHASSTVHEAVIADLEAAGIGAAAERLAPLRAAAAAGARALEDGDLAAYGAALSANTAAQAALHPSLVSAEATGIIGAARAAGAAGWKVNGAGGDGGSLTLLAGSADPADATSTAGLSAAVGAVAPTAIVRTVRIDPDGVRVRVLPPGAGG
jgi:D-glycero-alpha-D-manno-heptose-7-phosphate kinase